MLELLCNELLETSDGDHVIAAWNLHLQCPKEICWQRTSYDLRSNKEISLSNFNEGLQLTKKYLMIFTWRLVGSLWFLFG